MLHRYLLRWVLASLGSLLATTAFCQDPRGTILGTVSDASGAIVPGANVTVTNVDTGVPAKGASNGVGQFSVPFLTPGIYRVTVEKPGFKTYIQENVELRVSESVDLKIRMEVGSAIERVDVTAT
ncbi:MAG: carboxypeptidase regulatory-like domain-containing protein, partial [Acidobacteriia bacterium]|nr:carboxypeptidase regulatory-like domain-containing protein [Terriglobia bacterium]